MQKRFWLILTFLWLTHVCWSQFDVQANDLIGTWQHQKSEENPSQLVIESVDSITLEINGYFSSPSGTDGSEFALKGVVNVPSKKTSTDTTRHQALAVNFSVQWKDYGSITSWTGICFKKENRLHLNMQWLLVRAVSDYEWDHVLTGYDLFVKEE